MTTEAANAMLWQDKSKMEELFERGYTQTEVADMFGCSQSTISKWKAEFGIEGNRQDKNGRSKNIPYFRTKETGYEVVGSWNGEEGTTDRVYIHRLIAFMDEGLDSLDGNYIHHKNRIPWDNRPENIEVMSPEEHGEIHGGDWE